MRVAGPPYQHLEEEKDKTMTTKRRNTLRWAATAILSAGTILMASEAAKPPSLATDARKDLVIAYQRAIIASGNAAQAQRTLQAAIDAFNALCVAETAKGGYAKGSSCAVDIDRVEVTVLAPPTPPASPALEKKK